MAGRRKNRITELTRAELDIMQIVWNLNREFIVRDVHECFKEPRPAYNTVSTLVRILDEKGFLTHKAYGRTNVYVSAVTKDEYTATYMKTVLTNFFDGSLSRLVTFFSSNQSISVEETDEILKILGHK